MIKEGYLIGRKDADLIFRDSKVSGNHARVERNSQGSLVLVDLGSANGIRLNDRKVSKITLISGISFKLGRSLLRVREEAIDSEVETEDSVDWRSNLIQQLRLLVELVPSQEMPIQALRPALRLEFLQGIQADESILLGYGPRSAGYDSPDIKLWEPNCPTNCFEIIPTDQLRPEFRTEMPTIVVLNGKSVRQQELQDGDLITIGYTKIQVRFVSELG